ncbi:peptidoglycan-binding protein [Streptomyces yokosukanensis]|uniref:Peptidoglycan-binding protein n=1 Tax=Streptomyces yokosukanensis TaxID=67386 RepID=A0A101P5K7_9ACTN|nr:peptidoglycan-binding domain-containing protein [Streptomyces yokosukanensis]KUN05332.1 peptidoglycan-binding protein [Streptomyces yokosukanensis]
MSDSERHTCPECGAPRGPDHSPSCDCTERAAEALRETRTAEAAAAEDFGPLRIRPYVEVTEPRSEPTDDTLPAAEAPPVVPMPPDAVPMPRDGAETRALPAVEVRAGESSRRRSPRTVLLSVAGAGVAVVAAAGFASGLFSYHPPSREPAAQAVRESVPQVSAPGPTSPTASPSPTAPRAPVPSPSAPATRPSPSATASASPTATPTPSAGTSRPASPAPSLTTSPAARTSPATAPVLRCGDRGPGVAELQQRLRQLDLYDDRIDGVYSRSVEDAVGTYQLARGIRDDTLGVYGPATRESLEAETREP